MKHKAVIFDLDGTLLDTIEDLADSMNNVLTRYNFPTHTVDEYKYFVGEGVDELIRKSLPENQRSDEMIKRCVVEMREEYSKLWYNKTRPYDGINELLYNLTKRNVKMAVLSNKIDHFTKMMVKKLLPDWNFQIVLGSRPNVPNKPDPTSAIEIANSFGVPPHEFIYLGDTSIDMETANNAGMYPIGALWGFRTAKELKDSGAKALIEKPMELLEYLYYRYW